MCYYWSDLCVSRFGRFQCLAPGIALEKVPSSIVMRRTSMLLFDTYSTYSFLFHIIHDDAGTLDTRRSLAIQLITGFWTYPKLQLV